jgi:hypothetical protein
VLAQELVYPSVGRVCCLITPLGDVLGVRRQLSQLLRDFERV